MNQNDPTTKAITEWMAADYFVYFHALPKEPFVPDATFWLVLGHLVGQLAKFEDRYK